MGRKSKSRTKRQPTAILKDLEQAPNLSFDKVVKRTTKRNPLPPFITSKLQQEAIRKLRFSAKKTMMVAQQLYEGIDLGPGEPVVLITYMRTDSTRIADEAAQEALALINQRFGKEYAIASRASSKTKTRLRTPMRPSARPRSFIRRIS
jgi:DNA topoisomerase-1